MTPSLATMAPGQACKIQIKGSSRKLTAEMAQGKGAATAMQLRQSADPAGSQQTHSSSQRFGGLPLQKPSPSTASAPAGAAALEDTGTAQASERRSHFYDSELPQHRPLLMCGDHAKRCAACLDVERCGRGFWCHAGAQGPRRSRSAASMLPAGRKRPPRTVRPLRLEISLHTDSSRYTASPGMISASSVLYMSLPAMPDPLVSVNCW